MLIGHVCFGAGSRLRSAQGPENSLNEINELEGVNTAPTRVSFRPAFTAMPPDGNRSRLSEVLKKFLDWREGEDGDRRAENDVAPIVQFAIELWKDPCIGDIGPEQLLMLKQAMPEVPTPAGFSVDIRSIFQRWTIAKENNYVIEAEGKQIKLARVSALSIVPLCWP